MTAMTSIARFRAWHFVAAALGLYAAITGFGLLVEGYNPDDWRHLAGDYVPWASNEGRWVMEVIFRDLLGNRFLMPLQLALAFLCFLAIAWVLSGAVTAAPDQRALTALLLFVAGVNFPYMADALNFNAHVFAYPFAMLLSLASFGLLVACMGRAWWLWPLATAVAGQGLAISYGIFQPFAVFGAVLPLIALLRWDRHPLGRVLVLMVACVLAAALAIMLHKLEWRAYMDAQGREIVTNRFGTPDVAWIQQMLMRLPFTQSLTLKGALMVPFRPARALLLAFSLAALLAPVLATLWRARSLGAARGILAVLRAALAGLALIVVLPSVFFFMARPGEWPPRAVGYLGFWIAALIFAALAILNGAASGRGSARWTLPSAVGTAAVAVFAALNLGLSALIWHDRADMSRAEMALAGRIHEAVTALEGYDGQTIRLVGDAPLAPLRWGGAMSSSVFHHNNPRLGIISRTYGLERLEQAVSVSPRTCPAFPAPGSVFLEGDYAYVCLQTTDALLPLADCEGESDPVWGRLCRKGSLFVRIFDTCPKMPPRDHQVRVSVEGRPGHGLPVYLNDNYPFIDLAGRCYQVADLLQPGPATLSLAWLPEGATTELTRAVSFP